MHLYKLEDFLLYELSCAGISWKTFVASPLFRPRMTRINNSLLALSDFSEKWVIICDDDSLHELGSVQYIPRCSASHLFSAFIVGVFQLFRVIPRLNLMLHAI